MRGKHPRSAGAREPSGRRNDNTALPHYETELVAACLRGDRVALAKLIAEYRTCAYAGAQMAINKTRRSLPCTAEDLGDEFLLELLAQTDRVLGRFDRRCGNLGGWLKTLAYRRSSQLLRSPRFRWSGAAQTSRTEALALGPAQGPHPADVVERLLVGLTPKGRWIIQAHFGLGPSGERLSLPEIARRLDCSRATACRRLRAAMDQLRHDARLWADDD